MGIRVDVPCSSVFMDSRTGSVVSSKNEVLRSPEGGMDTIVTESMESPLILRAAKRRRIGGRYKKSCPYLCVLFICLYTR
ncbi:conserved hypothetical protein [Ricinus communis]|uniref:Uncharacterized protein n=1 Tax=Ricinus communis TaxID=3988 RepID=B9SNW4_RICCO|nr:conserved hypothetical protein [Ricinus communis]